MSKSIQDVEGIGPKYATMLKEAGIKTTGALLDAGAAKKGRKALAEKTGIKEATILKWVNMCDLFRVKGVASQYAELLECAGVDTVKELRNRNAANLAEKMAEVNAAKRLCKVAPGTGTVTKWVQQAKEMEPKVTY